MLEKLVVGDMMAGRLADALVPFTTEAKDVDAELLFHVARDGVHIVADQPDRTGGENSDGLRVEQRIGLFDGGPKLLLPAKDDLLILHVGAQTISDVVGVLGGFRASLVAARQPAVEAAADGAVGDAQDVAGGADHHTLATGVGAA